MRVFGDKSPGYRRGMAALLAALIVGDVLAVRYHLQRQARQDALDAADRPRPTPQQGPPVRMPTPRPVGPPAQLVGGTRTQGPFTLTAITRDGASNVPPPGVASMTWVNAPRPMTDGTGLWIKWNAGIAATTRPAPSGPGRTVLVFGTADLVVTNMPVASPPPPPPTLLQRVLQFLTRQRPQGAAPKYCGSFQWCRADGVTPLPTPQQPFVTFWTSDAKNRQQILLIPKMDRLVTVTAQALTASGQPLGGPVTLHSDVAGADTFFACLPGGDSPRTARFALTVGPAGKPPQARWVLASLPPSLMALSPPFQAHTQQTIGPLTVRAAAVETTDSDGLSTGQEQPPPRTQGVWTLSPPQNVDNHPWTGVPTIRCVVQARAAKTSQDWQVNVLRVTPQWQPSPLPDALPSPSASSALVTLSVAQAASGQPAQADLACGIAYPGQQRWLRMDAEAIRHVTRAETVTFHNASVRLDPAAGRWEVVFAKPQTLTTPSGIVLTTLCRRPGVAPATPAPGDQPWNPNAAAELWLAWRLPPSIGAQPGPLALTPQALTPDVVMPQLASIFSPVYESPPDWQDVWMPGAPPPVLQKNSLGILHQPLLPTTPLAPLLHQGYQIVRLWVIAPRLLQAAGASTNIPSPTSAPLLPTRLPTLTVRVQIQGLGERHPIHLTLPVQTQFPAGWNPDAQDGRYQQSY